MNGAECGECGHLACKCEEIKRKIEIRKLNAGLNLDLVKVIEELYQALNKPKGLRFKLLRWMYPEIVQVADRLREYYWETKLRDDREGWKKDK